MTRQSVFTLIAFLFLSLQGLKAQELNCVVEVNSQQVNGFQSTFSTLKESITEYMNTTKFSEAQIAPNEKIDCKLFFTVKSYEDNTVKGDLQIQYTRPVYNSAYTTTVLNFKDAKIDFSYQEGEPLNFSRTDHESQLTAILNFYAYMILAMDFDTFSPRGGQPFWDCVAQVVRLAQSSGDIGWKAFDDPKNRAALLAAFTDPSTQIYRDLLYQYHRQGLDQMALSPDKGRAQITESLDVLKKIYDVAPMSVALSLFRDAKMDEMVNIYTKGTQAERDRAVEIFSSLYPTDNQRIEQIKKGVNK